MPSLKAAAIPSFTAWHMPKSSPRTISLISSDAFTHASSAQPFSAGKVFEALAASECEIAIVGGGIGGLAAAAFLRQAGLNSTVYEQAAELRDVGAGLVVAPNAARLLRRLGVLEALARRAVRLDIGWEFRRWQDGRVLSAENLAACERLYGEHTYTAHRADLLAAVKSAVPAEAIRLGRRCTGLTSRGSRPVLRFEDGQIAEADIVIGADGTHSVVRNAVAGPTPATYSGIGAFRSLIPASRAPLFAQRAAQTLWIGPGHHLVHYPVSAGSFVNLVAFAPATEHTRPNRGLRPPQ
jgi:2-polyprenyl-6-methoxyphenol hydroxylase-like FAD-dependent oxidoreductase